MCVRLYVKIRISSTMLCMYISANIFPVIDKKYHILGVVGLFSIIEKNKERKLTAIYVTVGKASGTLLHTYVGNEP